MDEYKIILEEKQTVMARYEVEPKSGEGYQSEAQLENALIKQLADQGYEYAKIKDEAALLDNLRLQLEELNDIRLSDSEWARLLPMISNEQMTILDKTEMLQGKGYILDTFEASIRNLEQQLAQREKQYEFYRNKLLTFE